MKAHYKTRDGRITFEVSGETTKDVFREIAKVQSTFEADWACGLCQSANIKFQTRVTGDESEWFELQCECGARLQFGQHKKGGSLYVKRERNDPHRGWAKWDRSSNERQEAR